MTTDLQRWLSARDARNLVKMAVQRVDRRLLIIAAAQCVRSVLFLTNRYDDKPHPLAVAAIEAAEQWVEREDTPSPMPLGDLKNAREAVFDAASEDRNEYGYRNQPRAEAMYAAGAVALAAIEATDAGRHSRITIGTGYEVLGAIDGAIKAWAHGHRESWKRNRLPGLMAEHAATLADVVRTVIPFTMYGFLIAMHPHMYVVWIPERHYSDPLDAPDPVPGEHWLGLQLQPRKVRGKWWHGQIRGPWQDVVQSIPDQAFMSLVLRKVHAHLEAR